MALANFSLPFGALTQPWGVTLSPLHPIHQLASNTNNLLYSPADHQQAAQPADAAAGTDYYKNNPYAAPALHQQQQQQQQTESAGGYAYNANGRRKSGNTYLPPASNTASVRNSVYHIQQQQHSQQQLDSHDNSVAFHSNSAAVSQSSTTAQGSVQLTQSRGPAEGSYSRFPQQQKQYYNAHGSATYTKNSGSYSITSFGSRNTQGARTQAADESSHTEQEAPAPVPAASPAVTYGVASAQDVGNYPERQAGFTRVQAGQGSRTQVHAVLDYDVEDGEEEDDDDESEQQGDYYGNGEAPEKDAKGSNMPTVTPIQGPIFLKNGSVPVVPLFSYPKLNNGTFLQIPIWWTALSVALGLDVRGDVIKGVPCIKRYHQLFCPTAGNSYPIEKIERFIDDNKALMRRMYGDFEMNMDSGGPRQQTKVRKRRFIDEPDIFIPPGAYAAHAGEHAEAGDSYFGNLRKKRQAGNAAQNRNKAAGSSKANNPGKPVNSGTGRLDACESKIEIVTPYWASNSAGKIRAIVNTQHFEQAIHQEVCSNTQTTRCVGDCGCEQKYKWHRLLAYDPDNDCKGIFMDWFLFPSCCVCRCNP